MAYQIYEHENPIVPFTVASLEQHPSFTAKNKRKIV